MVKVSQMTRVSQVEYHCTTVQCNTYKSQVDELQKEYKLATTHKNHLRIIQFFATGIIHDDRNCQIMIVMEYMERSSLADKQQIQQPLPENSVITY